MKLFLTTVSLLVLLISVTLGSFTFIQVHSQGGINWGDICLNPFVDKLITESCSSLTTNGGYQLTAEGKHVFACLAGGKSLLRADPTGTAWNYAQSLKSNFECDSSGEESSHRDYSRNNNHLDQSGDLYDPSQQGINFNWGALCSNPIVDGFISEPCDTLTTNGGYQLTPQGERAIACIAGGGILLRVDPTGQALAYAQSLKSTLGCGGNEGGFSDKDYSRNNNPLAQFGDLFVPPQDGSGSNQNPLGDLADKFLSPSQGSSRSNQNPLENLMGDLFGNK